MFKIAAQDLQYSIVDKDTLSSGFFFNS